MTNTTLRDWQRKGSEEASLDRGVNAPLTGSDIRDILDDYFCDDIALAIEEGASYTAEEALDAVILGYTSGG